MGGGEPLADSEGARIENCADATVEQRSVEAVEAILRSAANGKSESI